MLSCFVMLSGCVTPAPFPVPPPLPAEIVPLPPVSGESLIFQPGDWAYAGDSYRYEPGHYVPAAGHGTNWMFGHWAPGVERGVVVWVPGGWL